MKNIFIEGIQGMGKSTLLNQISASLPAYHACREGDYSPVDLAWCCWMTAEEYKQILNQYTPLREEIIQNTVQEGIHYIVPYTNILTDIPNFHRELETFEIYNGRKSLLEFQEIISSRYRNFTGTGYLFECSFFQNIIEDLILFHQLNDEEIIEFYQGLYNVAQKEDFLLLYLYSDQLEECIKTIKKERCNHQGEELWYVMMLEYLVRSPYGKQHDYREFADMISHFQHRQQLELCIIHEVIKNNAVILPAKNWEIETILNNYILS